MVADFEISPTADVIKSPNMKGTRGFEPSIGPEVDKYYAKTLHIDFEKYYPQKATKDFVQDIAQTSQGIYYYDSFQEDRIPEDRKLFVPSIEGVNWDSCEENSRRERARMVERHMINNETFNKSEFAWEADAWADIFGFLRDDNQLVIDKHEYNLLLDKVGTNNWRLTGVSTFNKRIPDATFGLSTYVPAECQDHYTPCDYRHCPYRFPNWNSALRRDKLERLAFHPKCGLLADPKWGESDMALPFMVYEAKGWSGDYREARRQACLAAKTYLDMLDHLSRVPSTAGPSSEFQTATSQDNQVFAITSYGAHWHLLVAFKKPRGEDYYAKSEGLSPSVYIFQKIWSGRVINERSAWELLCLIDQIHKYATTRFRNYVIQHLQTWHLHCKKHFLSEWKSRYSVHWSRKGKRTIVVDELTLPMWRQHFGNDAMKKLQAKAKATLVKVMEKDTSSERDREYENSRKRQKLQEEVELSQFYNKLVVRDFYPPVGDEKGKGKGKGKADWHWR